MEKRKDSCGGFVDLEEAHDRLRIEELYEGLIVCILLHRNKTMV